MNDNYRTRIETVIVEVNGQAIDCLSFTSRDQAETYKRSVRGWASERGICAQVFSQAIEVSQRARGSRPKAAPALVRAM